jgi:ferredoxin
MKRDILKIDENLCNGCGQCVPNCHEGALQVIDKKVRLVSELMCDGLGACIGHCSQGAITIEKREAVPYNEINVIKGMISKGKNTIVAHLCHLLDHEETDFAREGVNYLKSHSDELPFNLNELISDVHNHVKMKEERKNANDIDVNDGEGCPGSRAQVIERIKDESYSSVAEQPSELRQWPVQMHLINPSTAYFKDSDLLVAADCVAFSLGSFHCRFLKNKSLVIACPKLDNGTETYIEKLTALIDVAKINTITVMIMEVPCCGGLLKMVKTAVNNASRKVPVKKIIVGINGTIAEESWV